MPDSADEATPRCYRHPDRETMVRCSGCERPICTSCMHSTPVGVRCPECAGAPGPVRGAVQRSYRRGRAPVTIAIILVTIAFYIGQVVTSGPVGLSGGLTRRLELWGPAVADGEWWRIFTVALVHGNLTHLALNMISLWIVGSIVETGLGPVRYVGIYLAAIAWGSAGALLLEGTAATVGASGGIFGVFAAIGVVQLIRGGRISMDILIVLGLNLALTFSVPGISIGGHLGGIVGGAIAAAVIVGFDQRLRGPARTRAAIAGMTAVTLAGFVLALWAADRTVGLALLGLG